MSLIISSHPLACHYLSILRNKDTDATCFRTTTNKLAQILIVEATKELPLKSYFLSTPLEDTQGRRLSEQIIAVPILRAGLGMLDAAKEIIPNIQVGFIGVQRDEATAKPESYYSKFPDLSNGHVLILEPMLATGGSLSRACETLKKSGANKITAICVLVASPGVERVTRDHSDISIIAAGCDDKLDHRHFIVPGLGDMGDRLFGTN